MSSPEYTYRNSVLAQRDRLTAEPFGAAAVMYGIDPEFPRDPVEAVKFKRAELEKLRLDLRNLLASDHPDDKEAVKLVNDNFATYDWEELATELNMQREDGLQVMQLLANSTNAELEAFIRANFSLYSHRQRVFDDNLNMLRQEAIERIGRVVDTGILPESAREMVSYALLEQYVRVIDSLEAGLLMCEGYQDRNRVGIAHPFKPGQSEGIVTREASEIFTHEAGHAIGETNDCGFVCLLPEHHDLPLLAAVLEEPFIEHVTRVSLNGMARIMDPQERKDGGFYLPGRRLDSIVSTMGKFVISLDLRGEAFMESLAERRLPARRALHQLSSTTLADFFPEHEGESIYYVIARDLATVPRVGRGDRLDTWSDEIIKRVTGIQPDTK